MCDTVKLAEAEKLNNEYRQRIMILEVELECALEEKSSVIPFLCKRSKEYKDKLGIAASVLDRIQTQLCDRTGITATEIAGIRRAALNTYNTIKDKTNV